jgi:hypothetical protein
VVRLILALAAATIVAWPGPAGAFPPRLPAATFQDQDGRVLDLASVWGRVAVIVYGGRAGLEHHIAWGRRLDEELRDRGVYRAGDSREARPVWILAVAQMGRIPVAFRGMLRAALQPHVEPGHSLWLDWEDLLSTWFGRRDGESTVVVVDRRGTVRLVAAGRPEGEPYRAVSEALRRIE